MKWATKLKELDKKQSLAIKSAELFDQFNAIKTSGGWGAAELDHGKLKASWDPAVYESGQHKFQADFPYAADPPVIYDGPSGKPVVTELGNEFWNHTSAVAAENPEIDILDALEVFGKVGIKTADVQATFTAGEFPEIVLTLTLQPMPDTAHDVMEKISYGVSNLMLGKPSNEVD